MLKKLIILLCSFAPAFFAQSQNVFRSQTIGFELTKPNNWSFLTAQQNADNLKATQLTDQEFQATMLKYATAPLVAITKYPEPYPDLNPSLKVNIRPLGDLKGIEPAKIVGAVLPQLQRAFKDFTVVQQPTEVMIGGLKAGYARVHYTLQTSDGQTFPTASELWIVPRGDFFFMLGAGTRQDERTGSRAEISKILDTIRFER